jgi:hypothetical protein
MRSNAALLIVRVAKVFVSWFSVKWKIGALIHFQGDLLNVGRPEP